MDKSKYWRGNWKIGRPGTVVASEQDGYNLNHSVHEIDAQVEYYEGYLLCESLGCLHDTKVMAGAKKMIRHLILLAASENRQYIFEMLEQITGERWSMAEVNEAAILIRKEYPNA